MITSGFMAMRFLAVSIRVSPFRMELVEAEMLKVSALIRFAAISKDIRVSYSQRYQRSCATTTGE